MNTRATISNLGIVVALTLSLLVARRWEWNESIVSNILGLTHEYLFPMPSLDLPLEEQAAVFAKTTRFMEVQMSTWPMAKFMGEDFYRASFGDHPTKIAELSIPSGDDKYEIPIICSCPHNSNNVDSQLPLILYFFSGGLIMGSHKTELLLQRWLAQQAHVVVCAIGYRLVPQYPYPIPIEDSLTASLGILTTHSSRIEKALGTSINWNKIATWGASAGGFLAAHVARRLTQLGHTLSCQVALIPMVKPHGGTTSVLQQWIYQYDTWTAYKNAYSWTYFLSQDHEGKLAADWKVNLLVDPPQEVVPNLPPTYIQIHTKDVLRDEGESYAQRLKDQGKLIALEEFDTSHTGSMPGISRGGPGEGAIVKALQVLKDHVHN